MNVDWREFKDDFVEPPNFDLDRARLLSILRTYFEQNGLSMEWETIEIVANERLMNALSMICPLQSSEKQALLEEKSVIKRAELLMDLLLMNLNQNPLDETTQIH
jgi:Lon protease-like protein